MPVFVAWPIPPSYGLDSLCVMLPDRPLAFAERWITYSPSPALQLTARLKQERGLEQLCDDGKH